ncbi:MAG: PhoH family protein [Planctomycetota bacterium]
MSSKKTTSKRSTTKKKTGGAKKDPPVTSTGRRPRRETAGDKATSTKTFVLDTNVLLHNPKAIFVFQENNVVIPFTVLEELDNFKSTSDDIGRNARQAIRYLDHMRVRGEITQGVRLGNGTPAHPDAGVYGATGLLRIDIEPHQRPKALLDDKADNRIISVAFDLKERGERVVFVTKDINSRIKADALDITAEDFENQKVNPDRLYTGWVERSVDGTLIDELYSERMLPLDALPIVDVEPEPFAAPDQPEIFPNQFVLLHDQLDESHTAIARRLADTDHLIPVTGPRKPTFGIMARNLQQTMALDLLLNDDIKLVTLIGQAGTGKTLLAVAAGMTKVFHEKHFEKLLVARPIMPMGRDIGYLPGDKDEKLTAWMQPIFDNLSYLLSTRGSHLQTPDSHTAEQRVRKLMADGQLVLEPLTYIRGRSIPHQFIIVDEAQNLTPHEVKTIVSRVGEGTKIILTGDINQIDNPYLDSSSNGLTYCIDRMRGLPLYGHATLARSERSELASLAADLL